MDEPRTIAEIARAASAEIGVGIKTGAAQPLRNATALMSRLIAGDYEKGGDEKPEPKVKEQPAPKPKRERKPKPKARAKKPRR